MTIQLQEDWKKLLEKEFDKPYFNELIQFLKQEKKNAKIIYPPGKFIFHAFALTPPQQVKVVLLGQDPYHGFGQAHGLCFSVEHGIKPPPSLQNIYKEIAEDMQKPIPTHGNLEHWAKQGIFMLNSSLTVEANKPMSHSKIGWEQFTDTVIKTISLQMDGVIFILWGRFAQQKETFIDSSKHYILKAAHPSPFSAYNGFFGCKHFSKVNEILRVQHKKEIDW